MADFRLDYYASLWNYTAYDGPDALDEVIQAISAAGYGVELWPHYTSLAPYRASTGGPGSLLSPVHRARLADALCGLRSCWHGRLYEPDGRIAPITNTLDGHLAQIDLAADLGSRLVSVHDLGADAAAPYGLGDDLGFARRVLGHARARGVTVALETVGELPALRRAVADLDGLGICLDPAFIHRYGRHHLAEYLAALGDRVCSLHLYDNAADAHHLPPGRGGVPEVDWVFLLRSLRARGFAGPAILEIRSTGDAAGEHPLDTMRSAVHYLDVLIERSL